LVRLGRWHDALSILDRAIQRGPRAALYDQRGVLLALLKKELRALEDFAAALTLTQAPEEQARIYFHRGLLYGRRQCYDQALLDVKRAARLDPNQTYQEALEQLQRERERASPGSPSEWNTG
jgi:tetratricopeptide (TPR) repeat protein